MTKKIIIKKFKQSDKDLLYCLIEELQDYLILLDPLKRLRRLPGYGKKYIHNLLKKIQKNKGLILIAFWNNIPCGFIAGIIEKQNKDTFLEVIPSKEGRILELIVSEKQRGKNIGKLLMAGLEEYFRKFGCDTIRVEVFKPNDSAHGFYNKLGYQDRAIDLIKII